MAAIYVCLINKQINIFAYIHFIGLDLTFYQQLLINMNSDNPLKSNSINHVGIIAGKCQDTTDIATLKMVGSLFKAKEYMGWIKQAAFIKKS